MAEVDGTQAERKLGEILEAAEEAPASRAVEQPVQSDTRCQSLLPAQGREETREMTSKTLASNQLATPTDISPFDAPLHPAAAIMPEQSATEYAALLQDIERHGVRNPVCLDPEGRILDGRHRYRAAHQLGIGCPITVYDGSDPIGVVLSQNLHRRHLTTSQRAMVAAKMANLGEGRPSRDTPQNCGVSTKQAAARFRVGRRTVESAKTVLEYGSPQLVRAVEMGEISVGRAAALATAATHASQPIEGSELSSPPDTNQKTPPAADPSQIETCTLNRRRSLRDIVTFVARVSRLLRTGEKHGASISDPRIAAKLRAVPADERERWITTVHDACETLGRFERQLQRAFQEASGVSQANVGTASVPDGDAPPPR
jgi:ParB-like chromosome segregation protein Spo0J